MDSWSVFGFAQKNEKSVFGFENPDLDVPNLDRDVILLKRWFPRKEVVTDISNFEVQGVYLPKELAGGGGWWKGAEIPKYIGHYRQGLEGVSRDPRFDPNLLRGYGIWPLLKRWMPQNLDMRYRIVEENGIRERDDRRSGCGTVSKRSVRPGESTARRVLNPGIGMQKIKLR